MEKCVCSFGHDSLSQFKKWIYALLPYGTIKGVGRVEKFRAVSMGGQQSDGIGFSKASKLSNVDPKQCLSKGVLFSKVSRSLSCVNVGSFFKGV